MNNKLYKLNYRLKMLQDKYYKHKRKYRTLINELDKVIHDINWDIRVDNYCKQYEPKYKFNDEFYLTGCYEIPTPPNHIMFQRYGINSDNLNRGFKGIAKIKYIDDITYSDKIFYLLNFLGGEVYIEESILSKFEIKSSM